MRYFTLLMLLLVFACQPKPAETPPSEEPAPSLSFESIQIADNANLWWARTIADVDGDGIPEIILQDNNGSGGWLGYLKDNGEGGLWEATIVAETAPGGGKFAAGDLDAADMDGDGDLDLIGVEHPGEWSDADADAIIYIYYQDDSGWSPKEVGSIPSALKDISIGDLDGDGSPEIVTATYNAETLSVFGKTGDGEFGKLWDLKIDNLHEGLDIGDLDGDGDTDIAANGLWLSNPGSLEGLWEVDTIDVRWISQEEEHWARNATKVVCRDVDADGMAEVFISHSEKSGYPVMQYDFENDAWSGTVIIDELPAAHSLVVEDFDQDGDYEIATGVNRNRAINISEEMGTPVADIFPVLLMDEVNGKWVADTLNTDGVYNLLSGDMDGDGDTDLVRLTSHDLKDMWLLQGTISN